MLVSLLAAASRPRLAARRHEREHFRVTRRAAEDERFDLLHARLRSTALHDDSLWGVPLTSEPASDSRHLLRRFLEARDWDVDQAADMIEGTLAWRSEFGAAATQADAFPGSECGRDDSGSAQIVLRLEHVREDAFADVARYARWCVSLHEACRPFAAQLLSTTSTVKRLERVLKVQKALVDEKYRTPRSARSRKKG